MKMHEILHRVQRDLKAPKDKYNSFGEYSYRSQQMILERVKPLLPEGVIIVLSDEIKEVAGNAYVYATATISSENGSISCSAGAREDKERKKMQPEQLTGSSSSYARKYALMGLLAIDDTKDADTIEESTATPVGHIDTDVRKEADDMFALQLEDAFNKCESSMAVEDCITPEIKKYLGKLSKTNIELFTKLKNRKDSLIAEFKVEEAKLLKQF